MPMRIRTKQGLHTLRRAHQFLVAREYSFAVGELAPHAVALAALVTRLQLQTTEQDTHAQGARAATGAKITLRRALRQEYLRPIAEVAKKLLVDDPKVRLAHPLPSGRDDEGLLQVANGFRRNSVAVLETMRVAPYRG
ncbi:MAG: hypothetical protein ABI910_15540 [Gemmatimonadota bacterium]